MRPSINNHQSAIRQCFPSTTPSPRSPHRREARHAVSCASAGHGRWNASVACSTNNPLAASHAQLATNRFPTTLPAFSPARYVSRNFTRPSPAICICGAGVPPAGMRRPARRLHHKCEATPASRLSKFTRSARRRYCKCCCGPSVPPAPDWPGRVSSRCGRSWPGEST